MNAIQPIRGQESFNKLYKKHYVSRIISLLHNLRTGHWLIDLLIVPFSNFSAHSKITSKMEVYKLWQLWQIWTNFEKQRWKTYAHGPRMLPCATPNCYQIVIVVIVTTHTFIIHFRSYSFFMFFWEVVILQLVLPVRTFKMKMW